MNSRTNFGQKGPILFRMLYPVKKQTTSHLSVRSGPILYKQFSCAMLSQKSRYSIVQAIFLINIVSHIGQHCTSNFLVQRWLRQIQTKLYMIFLCRIVCGLWVNNAPEKILLNLVLMLLGQNSRGKNLLQLCLNTPWTTLHRLTKSLCNVVFEAPGNNTQEKFCLYHCCPNTFGTTLDRSIPYAMLSESLQTTYHRKKSCTMLR